MRKKTTSKASSFWQIEPGCLPYLQQEPVILGLSGGRDSVALLLALMEHGADVHACHVHHGIRGAEADADAAFCRELCQQNNIPFELHHIDVPRLAKEQGCSLETAARHARREILANAATAAGGHVVALAHHEDDQAETVLFRLARGSAGLRGMQPVHEAQGIIWIRPLLCMSRAEITKRLHELEQAWVEDATNTVADVTRNKIRLEVMPALQQAMGRSIAPILNRSARRQDESRQALDEALAALPLTDPQGRLFLPALYEKSSAFCKAAIHRYLSLAHVSDINEEMVNSVYSILAAEAPVARVNLPGNMQACRKCKRLEIHTAKGELLPVKWGS